MKKSNLFRKTMISVACMSFLGTAFANYDNLGVSHSYFVNEMGRPFTVKSELPPTGWSTLFSPNGFFYQKNLVEHFGSKYIVMDGARQVHTIDSRGEMYKGITQYADGSLRVKGANYFITSKGTLYIIKTNGELTTMKTRKEDKRFKRFSETGGMFFISRKDRQFAVTNPFTGKLDMHGKIKIDDIEVNGDNFFFTEDGKLYTIGFEESGDSFASTVNENALPNGVVQITKSGGNFFFDQTNRIHTINDRGEINAASNGDGQFIDDRGTPELTGGNFFQYADGALYLVDEYGAVQFVEVRSDKILVTNK